MNKLLLVFYGETFRNGGQMTRNRDNNIDTIERQFITTDSHIRLINYITNILKINCETALLTYKFIEELDLKLIKLYNPVNYELHDDPLNPTWKSRYSTGEAAMLEYLSTCFKNIIINNNYSHVLFIRIDFYIKQYFYECLNFNDSIFFSFPDLNSSFEKNFIKYKNMKEFLIADNVDFNICHNISQYPKKFYHLLFEKKILSFTHHIYIYLINNNLVKLEDIDFFIKTFHTSCSNLSYNPIWANSGRKELLIYKDHNTYNNRLLEGNINYFIKNGTIFVDKNNKYKKLYEELINQEILPWSIKN